MYSCLLGIRRYYSMDSCINLKYLEEKKIDIVWYLKNGTSVVASTREEIVELLKEEVKNLDFYWATQITESLWEVQFSKIQNPRVKVMVTANNGKNAGELAKFLINIDYANMEIIDYNVLS